MIIEDPFCTPFGQEETMLSKIVVCLNYCGGIWLLHKAKQLFLSSSDNLNIVQFTGNHCNAIIELSPCNYYFVRDKEDFFN